MFAVEVYASVRQFVFVEGNSKREAARVFGLARETVDKICLFSVPPGYRRTKPPERRKLCAFLVVIDGILAADALVPPKQRHTSQRIFERLRDEHGFTGGYTVVKDHVRRVCVQARETFVPSVHPPGHAQVDFGEAVAVIGGERCKVHFFCLDLPHSDACFVKAYLAETTEALLDGHMSAFALSGGCRSRCCRIMCLGVKVRDHHRLGLVRAAAKWFETSPDETFPVGLRRKPSCPSKSGH